MKVKEISLKNFRSFDKFSCNFSEGTNIIFGENAAGKTNILEGIFVFATAKSFRGSKESEMIRFGENNCESEILYEDRYSENRLKLCFRRNKSKLLLKNSLPVSKVSEYIGQFRAVIFTPDHLNLAKGSPEFRRRFIDMAICQSFPKYVAALNEYNRMCAQKNALLKKSYNADSSVLKLLDVYNEKMAYSAGIISVNRQKYIKALSNQSKNFHKEISSGNEELTLEYLTNAGNEEYSKEEYTEAYIKLYNEKKEAEIYRGMCLFGPQKDDFRIQINGKNSRYFSSQGQQRTAVLCLKLAEGELSKELTGEYPVFLLDDVLSELDDERKKKLLMKIPKKQVIITGCDTEAMKKLDGNFIELHKK